MTGRVIARPAPARLSRSADVRRVLRDGQRRAGRLMAIHSLPRSSGASDAPDPAFGPDPAVGPTVRATVVASRRVGNAVQRNRAKRLLREAARTQDWREGFDVVLVARSACASSGLAEVTDELRTLGARLGVLDGREDGA